MNQHWNTTLSANQHLPEGWQWSTLGEVSIVFAGNPAPQGGEYFEGGIHPFVRVQDMGRMGSASQLSDTNDHINERAIKRLRLFPKGSVLFTKSGASTLLNQRAILGKDMYVVNHIAAAIPREGILSEWLYYWLNTVDFRNLAHATTLPSLPLSMAKSIPVPLASPEEQKRTVVEIEKQFSRLDEAIANLKRIKSNLKRYKAAVLKAAVEGKLTEQWRKEHPDVEPADKLLERILTERRKKWEQAGLAKMKPNGKEPKGKKRDKNYREPSAPYSYKMFSLPKGWIVSTLDAFCYHIGDVDHKMPKSQDCGIPYVSTRDFLPNGEIDYSKAKKIGVEDYNRLRQKIYPDNGDILMSRYGTVGEVRLVKNAGPFQVSYSIAIIKPALRKMNVYLALVLRTDLLQKQIQKYTRATAQPDLGLAHIKQLVIPLPPMAEQELLVEEVERCFSVVDKTEKEVALSVKRAERLRQFILKRAFSGEL